MILFGSGIGVDFSLNCAIVIKIDEGNEQRGPEEGKIKR